MSKQKKERPSIVSFLPKFTVLTLMAFYFLESKALLQPLPMLSIVLLLSLIWVRILFYCQ